VLATYDRASHEPPAGDPAVYAEIYNSTDCAKLDDTANRNLDDAERRLANDSNDPLAHVVSSYAIAAARRMETLGC
jgi:hypothetical protein